MKTLSIYALTASACVAAMGIEQALAQSSVPLSGEGNAALPYMAENASDVLPANVARTVGSVSILQVRPNVYMLTVGGNNIAVFTGIQGTLVVDSGADNCDDVIAAVNSVSMAPIRYIVLTGPAADRIGCGGALSKSGEIMPSEGLRRANALIMGHQNIAIRMADQASLPSTAVVPEYMFTRSTHSFGFNDQSIQVVTMPAATTDADSVVVLRQPDVVVTGNVLDITRFPVIDIARGGSIQGELDALNRLLTDIAVPATPTWEGRYGTLVIPARGHLSNQTDILFYRDAMTIIRDRIASLIEQGKSLAQVQTADPARGYKTRYGADEGPWTTRDFVAAVYNSLMAERRATRKRG